MPLRLSFETGTLAGIHIVTSAPIIRLGRDPQTNDILLTNPKVSRKHAVIERSVRGGYSLEVLGTGPSQLNGDPVAAVAGRPTVHPLSTGDRLAFGGIELTVSEATVKLIAVSGPSAGRELAVDGTVRQPTEPKPPWPIPSAWRTRSASAPDSVALWPLAGALRPQRHLLLPAPRGAPRRRPLGVARPA